MKPQLGVALCSSRLDRTLLVRRVDSEGQAEVHVILYAGPAVACQQQLAAWAGPASEVAVFVDAACDGGEWLSAGLAAFVLHDRAEAEALRTWLSITAPAPEMTIRRGHASLPRGGAS